MKKTLTPNQNQSCYKELKNLKRQNKQTVLFAGVDGNIFIVIVIILGVDRP